MLPTEVSTQAHDAATPSAVGSTGQPAGTPRPRRVSRVVVVNDFGHVNGGAAQVAIASAIGLRRRGLEVLFFCAVAPIDPSLVEAGIEVVCLHQHDILTNPSRVDAAISGAWNRQAHESLKALLRRLGAEGTLVHVHGWSKALSTSIYDAIAASGAAVVSTQHEFFAVCPNGGLYDYRAQATCRLVPMSAACMARNCDVRSYAHKAWRVARQAVASRVSNVPRGLQDVIYLSSIARQAAESYMGAQTRWHYVRNPVSAPRHERAHAEANARFIYVGRLAPEKGADLFLDAARRAGVPATVVGDGDMRAGLQASHPEARFTGWLQSGAVMDEIRQARALVFPSRWYETFGLTALESLAQGVPVVVADGTAAADVVVDGENGFVFEQGRVERLAEALAAFGDDERVRRMSEAAYARYWRDPPTVEAHVSALLEVFEEVLRTKAGAGSSPA